MFASTQYEVLVRLVLSDIIVGKHGSTKYEAKAFSIRQGCRKVHGWWGLRTDLAESRLFPSSIDADYSGVSFRQQSGEATSKKGGRPGTHEGNGDGGGPVGGN